MHDAHNLDAMLICRFVKSSCYLAVLTKTSPVSPSAAMNTDCSKSKEERDFTQNLAVC